MRNRSRKKSSTSSSQRKQKIVVLGSTGSIGRNTIAVARRFPQRLSVVGIGAGSNVDALAEQARQCSARYVGVYDQQHAATLQRRIRGARIVTGMEGMCELAALPEADTVVIAIMGSCALLPLIAAIKAGKKIALANKE